MGESFTKEQWIEYIKFTHRLIIAEFDSSTEEQLPMQYPKLIVMYNFFRLLRGESFQEQRPSVGELQDEFYKMEHEIEVRLIEFRNKIKKDDDRTKFYLDEMKTNFEL